MTPAAIATLPDRLPVNADIPFTLARDATLFSPVYSGLGCCAAGVPLVVTVVVAEDRTTVAVDYGAGWHVGSCDRPLRWRTYAHVEPGGTLAAAVEDVRVAVDTFLGWAAHPSVGARQASRCTTGRCDDVEGRGGPFDPPGIAATLRYPS